MPIFRMGIYDDIRHRLNQNKQDHVCFVATIQTLTDQKLVGMVEVSVRYLNTWTFTPIKVPYISNLAVSSEYRRLGIASKLLNRCEIQSQHWHYEDVALHVLENNQAAKQLYSSCGYDVKYEERPFSAWILGRPRRLFVQKKLFD